MVRRETAYKGTTNRWRENPGCFERHLQRMEGNPLYPEDQREPSDGDIRLAREKDDADLKQLDFDVQKLFEDSKDIGEGGVVQRSPVVDYLQYRAQPLMSRAAGIGDLAAGRYIPILRNLIIGCLETLKKQTGSDLNLESLERSWRLETNVFIAQTGRDDSPFGTSGMVLSLLCESAETIEGVLNIYRGFDAGLVEAIREMTRLQLELAKLDGFELPGAAEKLAVCERPVGHAP